MTDFNTLYGEIFRRSSLERFINDELTAKFCRLTELLIDYNSHTNLTAIRDLPSIIAKHYADSLVFDGTVDFGAKLIDVGCGAGFPSLPLAIARPDLKITALDSTRKKTEFIVLAASELGLDNLSVVCGRAEELAKSGGNLRESFDVAVARAVASLDVLSEYCLPLVKVGGKFISLKSASAVSELDTALGAISRLGGKYVENLPANVAAVSADDENSWVTLEHIAFIVQKAAATPKNLPRPAAQIAKKPLR